MKKRLIAAVLALLMVLIMPACNSNDVPPTEDTDPTKESAVPGVADLDVIVTNPHENEGSEATDPTNPSDVPEDPTEEGSEPSDSTEPSESDPTEDTEETTPSEETTPTEESTPPTEDPNQGSSNTTAYEEYIKMSGEQQLAFMQSFESPEAFFAWLNAAKAEYEAQNPGIDVDDGDIDLGGGN